MYYVYINRNITIHINILQYIAILKLANHAANLIKILTLTIKDKKLFISQIKKL